LPFKSCWRGTFFRADNDEKLYKVLFLKLPTLYFL
jgi:hypothetical protein